MSAHLLVATQAHSYVLSPSASFYSAGYVRVGVILLYADVISTYQGKCHKLSLICTSNSFTPWATSCMNKIQKKKSCLCSVFDSSCQTTIYREHADC